ncbi:CHASE domain-containing protein [Colwellia ponticola]|uniref:histidine kinase n=1 Tax=Colwellia ponticola TaxID=2304625 RepID=A0A8H2JJM2_9GAMM|nr:CHASE domain-containing protein [Colwellia ponticola]TMM41986.1 histidine kinase [Colwellia ponticola]
MMQRHLSHFFISALLFIVTSFGTVLLITPQSLVSFVGPCAALLSGLLLVWRLVPLIVVVIISPILAFSFDYYLHLDANFTVMTIAVLAIVLQACWTKQLVFRFIHYKKWLSSRKYLFFFLLRIGPIASLVSASSVLVISILDSRVTQGDFLYTFISTWSASMLMAVFFIPLLLLFNNAEQLKLTKRFFIGFTSLLGGLAVFLLLKSSQYQQQQYRQVLFEQATLEIERLIMAEVNAVVTNVTSLAALFKANDTVSLTEFTQFSDNIFKQDSSVRALEWAPIVPLSERATFEKNSSTVLKKDFSIKDKLANGTMVVAPPRPQYAPLYYLYPQAINEAALGVDFYGEFKHSFPLQAFNNEEIMASAPVILAQDKVAIPAILFRQAIFSIPEKQSAAELIAQRKLSLITKEKLLGLVIAVVQFDRFFEQLAQEKSAKVNIFIQDITADEPITLFGQLLPSVNRHVDTLTLSVFSRLWQVNIAEKEPWFSQTKSWQAWAVLLGGTFGAVLFQMLLLMMAAYSSELGEQVHSKTRNLILAREKSEKKSLAQSYFLKTLNTELRVPLLAIRAFVEQLKERGIHNKEVTGISHASSNLALLLDTMLDVSNIESGKVTAKNDCFDFYRFLQRTESVLKASNEYEGRSIYFLIDDSVPHYLNSDQLYIQKLIYALIESAHQLLKTNKLRLSIKLHQHKPAEASLFFTLSEQNPVTTALSTNVYRRQTNNKLIIDSTAFSLATHYSQLLRGDTNLATLSSGAGVLNSSIRVNILSSTEQIAAQDTAFDLKS